MTHNELLHKINMLGHTSSWAALTAVVKLHKPVEAEYFDNPVCAECSADIDTYFDYPCQTIKAIEQELL